MEAALGEIVDTGGDMEAYRQVGASWRQLELEAGTLQLPAAWLARCRARLGGGCSGGRGRQGHQADTFAARPRACPQRWREGRWWWFSTANQTVYAGPNQRLSCAQAQARGMFQ